MAPFRNAVLHLNAFDPVIDVDTARWLNVQPGDMGCPPPGTPYVPPYCFERHTCLATSPLGAPPVACRRGAGSRRGRPPGPCPAQRSAAGRCRSRRSARAAGTRTRPGCLSPARPAPPGRPPGPPRASPPAATTCVATAHQDFSACCHHLHRQVKAAGLGDCTMMLLLTGRAM